MIEFFEGLTYWQWGILAIVLVFFEITLPGVIFLWVGIGAGITGIILSIFPEISWEIQFVLFATLSITASIAGRMWVTRNPIQTDHPNLNQRERQHIGRTAPLTDPILNGRGTLQLDGTIWKIKGPDTDAGQTVQVVDTEGTTLIVELTSDD